MPSSIAMTVFTHQSVYKMLKLKTNLKTILFMGSNEISFYIAVFLMLLCLVRLMMSSKLEKAIRETQLVLKPIISRPKCSSKLLAKPPFR